MKNVTGISLVLLVVAILAINPIIHFSTLDTVNDVIVTGKERIVERSGEATTSKYLIFTQDETFQNTDTIWALKYNSSDVYGKIGEGFKCNFKVTGFRIKIFSWYRNILSADCEPLVKNSVPTE